MGGTGTRFRHFFTGLSEGRRLVSGALALLSLTLFTACPHPHPPPPPPHRPTATPTPTRPNVPSPTPDLRQPTPSLPVGLDVDATPASGSDGDGVLEPGETVSIQPTWFNSATNTLVAGGEISDFTGPGDASYAIVQGSTDYDPIPPHRDGTCVGCYTVSVGAGSARPATHWDAVLTETVGSDLTTGDAGPALELLNPASWIASAMSEADTAMQPDVTKIWTIHVGDSFPDVPRSHPSYRRIETLLHLGIASGCSPVQFCPEQPLARRSMAALLARAMAGSDLAVAATGRVGAEVYSCSDGGNSLFQDVPPTDPSCRYAHYLLTRGVSPGCSTTELCPDALVARADAATALGQAVVAGGIANIPLSMAADSVTGRSYDCNPAHPSLQFTDVSPSDPSCKAILFLWARGLLAGCSETEFCPTQTLTRGAAASLVGDGFALELYGPTPPPDSAPADAATALDLGGRFHVEVSWQATPDGPANAGNAVPLSATAGAFWFFDPEGDDLVVKVLDGTAVNGSSWVFYGGLSSVAYTITVTDAVSGLVRTYVHAAGDVSSGLDLTAFPGTGGAGGSAAPSAKTSPAPADAAPCAPGGPVLCLDQGRFQVTVSMGDSASPAHSLSMTHDSGGFWFFDSDNPEVVVKLIDGTAVNGHIWFFAASLTNLAYSIEVTDTTTQSVRTYSNPAGHVGSTVDTGAF